MCLGNMDMRAVLILQITLTIHHSFSEKRTEKHEVVRSVFEDDPLVREALDKEGPDWILAPHDTECHYNHLRQECHHLQTCNLSNPEAKIRLLTECRRECRDIHGPNFELDGFGGIEDFVDQHFGFRIPVCSLREGFSDVSMGTAPGTAKKLIQMYKDYIPAFTSEGFQKTQVPKDLLEHLVNFRDESVRTGNIIPEPFAPGVNGPTVIQNEKLQKSKQITIKRTFMMDLDQYTKRKILNTLTPLAEKWADIQLIPKEVYGIRRYLNMTTLLSHVDHPIGAIGGIINVDQEVEEDWPLFIQDNRGEDHEVILKPGEMILYESARLIHGRPRPLRGHYYDNVLVHFKPRGLWYRRIRPDDPSTRISAKAVRQSQR